jgi:o-succinylbenzoate synthase
MRVEQIDIRHVRLEQAEAFETSFGRFAVRDTIILTAFFEGGVTYAEAPTLPIPCFSYETIETALHVIRDFLAPAVVGRSFSSAEALHAAMSSVRGHPIAKGAIDAAWFHAASMACGTSLSRYLNGCRDEIEAGISIGIQPSLPALARYVRRVLSEGYARIKIKVKPGWDIEPVSMLRREFGGIPLMVDANGAYTLNDLAVLRELDRYQLMMIEQPLAFDDICDHATLQDMLATPICLDESIDSVAGARAALAMRACRVVNIKLSRVGGFGPAIRIHDMCAEHGILVWCGGMFETAIGKADSLVLASLPNFVLPADIGPSHRYYKRDLIAPFVPLESGRMKVPTAPGLGFEVDHEFLDASTVRRYVVRPPVVAVSAEPRAAVSPLATLQ